MRKNINKKINQYVIDKDKETVWVYLKASNTKSSSYDPYRNTGYTTTNKSPEPVKAYVSQVQQNSLVMREIGIIEVGAIEILINENDLELFKICQKVKYNDVEYSPYIKKLGNRVQIYDVRFGLKKILLFRRYS